MKACICWVLCLLALVATAAAQQDAYPWLPGYRKAPEPVFPEIFMSAEEAAPLLESGQLRVLEPLSDSDFLPGASILMVPLYLSGSRDLREDLGSRGLTGNETVLIASSSSNFRMAIGLYWLLKREGLEEVRILKGGKEAWIAQGHPVFQHRSSNPGRVFLAPSRPELEITVDELVMRTGESGLEILDLRGEAAWRGEDLTFVEAYGGHEAFKAQLSRAAEGTSLSISGEAGDDSNAVRASPRRRRKGHIPQALVFDPGDYLVGEAWPDPSEALSQFSKLGPRERDYVDLQAEFILYDRRGRDLDLFSSWLLLHSMGLRARILCGGFQCWEESEDSPVVRIVDDEEVAELLAGPNEPPIILDLRGHRDWYRSHIPGSVCLPAHVFADSLEAVIDDHWPGADLKRTPMVLYCYGADCVRSRNGAARAARAGFVRLLWYREGIEGWRVAGRPLEP